MIKPATSSGGSGSVSIGAFGSSPDDKGATASGSVVTMQPADATHPGMVSTAAQSFGGAKTFAAGIISTTGAFSGAISSSITGAVALQIAEDGRLSLGTPGIYFRENSGVIKCQGGFFPNATVSFDMGSAGAIWGSLFCHSVLINGGHIRDMATTSRVSIAASAGNTYTGKIADGGTAVAHAFDNTVSLTNAAAKLMSVRNNTSEKAFLNVDGELELTTVSKGIILKSADGTRYRLIIADGGTVSIAAA